MTIAPHRNQQRLPNKSIGLPLKNKGVKYNIRLVNLKPVNTIPP